MGYNDHLLAVASIFGFFDAFGIGANDVANSFSTAVNSGVLTMTQVAILAPILEFAGAMGVGKNVAGTIAKSILDASLFKNKQGVLQLGMTCALIASSTYLQLANYLQWPVSTTHTIVGGVIGVGISAFGSSGVNWWGYDKVKCGESSGYFAGVCSTDVGFAPIVFSWMASPVLAGVFAATMFAITKYSVLVHKNSFKRALWFAPLIYGLVGGVLSCFIVYKGSGKAGLDKKASDDIALASCLVALGCIIFAAVWISWWKLRVDWNGEDLKTYEWPYHFIIPKRHMRANFDAKHLDVSASTTSVDTQVAPIKDVEAGDDVVVAKPAASGVEKTSSIAAADLPSFITDVDARLEGTMNLKISNAREALAVLTAVQRPNFTADAIEERPVPAVIAAAMAEAESLGYVIREVGESERVYKQYKKTFMTGSWTQRLLLPFRMLFCHGIVDADGNERKVRSHIPAGGHGHHHNTTKYDDKTEDFFRVTQILTSCLASFAHGANDVANAIGPFSVVYGVWNSGKYASSYEVKDWMLAMGGAGIGLGFIMYGYHLMRSLGHAITYHSPSRGYCMELGAGVTVLLASRLGIPVSTTQCITGATIGVGMMSGIRAVNWKRCGSIFFAWIVTVPIVGIWTGLLFSFVAYSPTLRSPLA